MVPRASGVFVIQNLKARIDCTLINEQIVIFYSSFFIEVSKTNRNNKNNNNLKFYIGIPFDHTMFSIL